MAAISKPKLSHGDPIQLGALAILCGLWYAKSLNLAQIVMEGDIRDMFTALNDPKPCLAPFGTLVDDIRLESSVFSVMPFNYVPPSCNSAAISLAKEALLCNPRQVWFAGCPTFLLSFV
jgi:hypothetical protein